jgi:hypothetical protein
MDPNETPKPLPTGRRPFFLTLLCIFAGIYYFLFAALFTAGFFFSGWVTNAINMYAPVVLYSKAGVTLTLAGLSLLFILSFTGIVVMFFMRRPGYWIFGVSSLLLSAVQLFRPTLSFSGPVMFILFLILFGLYFRRFR